jgi:hypothetical protein
MAAMPLVLEADRPALKHGVTTVVGLNADLIAEVNKVPRYCLDGKTVGDVTFGLGHFWTKMDTTRFTLLGTDVFLDPDLTDPARLSQGTFWPDGAPVLSLDDFRALSYEAATLDTLVLDPPYEHDPGETLEMNKLYRNFATSKGMRHQDILRDFYAKGIQEAWRVVRPGGFLWVKGKDQVESSRQCWSHAEVRMAAERCGFTAEDLYILVTRASLTQLRGTKHRQIHARKNSSFLWIFQRKADRPVPKRGRPKKGSALTTHTQGRGREYLESRLRRDYPQIHARWMAGELPSVHAAAVEAGLVTARR